jgi:hypothetical protein
MKKDLPGIAPAIIPSPLRNSVVNMSGFTLVQLAILLMAMGLFVGGIMMGRELIETYHIHSEITQIGDLDAAIRQFYGKYEGLPGDLLAIKAEREGLPAGNGTPGHSDGDGNISPCNLGWQWHLGCETALFWSHLSVSGMIAENFTADSRFTDFRLSQVGSMFPYLPQSRLGEGIYIAVWNTNASQPSPRPQLPYGNYYEISGILGVIDEQMRDNSHVMTPAQAHAIDAKMDDGLPFTGRVLVNGEADWPKDAWGTFAKPGDASCVSPKKKYNIKYLRSGTPLCHLAIKLECCGKEEGE